MPKKTPSFVTTIPLKVSAGQEQALLKRFEAARQVYNACLSESLKRLDLMRQSKAWQAAKKMPRGDRESKSPAQRKQANEKADAYADLDKEFSFSSYDLQSFARQFGYSWIGHHLDSQTVKRLAERAFIWVKEYKTDRDRGKPKFKRYKTLNAVESINNLQGIIWRDDKVIWSAGRYGQKLILDTIIDYDDPVMRHGLSSRIKFVRLVHRSLNGQARFYAQLVGEGKPYQRFERGAGVIGLDLGPSTVAIVGPERARLKLLCEELADSKAKERRLQRKIERQRRANNPENYNADGTVKPRSQRKPWEKSGRQGQTEIKLAEIKRKQAEYRKSLHGQLINQILQMGSQVNLEKLSYVAFQKRFGKSVGVRAPGMFVARLRQKMNNYGGLVDEFSTHNTKFSQLDHKTRTYSKKPLSQRWHTFADGERVQRDLYSAFLATCLEDGEFKATLADERWEDVRHLLQLAVDDAKDREKRPTSFGF